MNEITDQNVRELKNSRDAVAVFFYTPLCGTCKWAARMTEHLERIYSNSFVQANINQMPEVAQVEKIESVPCLKIFQQGEAILTIYAFESIPSLLKRLHGLLALAPEYSGEKERR